MKNIRVKSDANVYKQDWEKVEALPFGGPYSNKHNGFNDHIDESGNVYRVKFATWNTPKKVVKI